MLSSPYRVLARRPVQPAVSHTVDLHVEWLVLLLSSFAIGMAIWRQTVSASDVIFAFIAWSGARAILFVWWRRLRGEPLKLRSLPHRKRKRKWISST